VFGFSFFVWIFLSIYQISGSVHHQQIPDKSKHFPGQRVAARSLWRKILVGGILKATGKIFAALACVSSHLTM